MNAKRKEIVIDFEHVFDKLTKPYEDLDPSQLSAELSKRSLYTPKGGIIDTVALLSFFNIEDMLYLPETKYSNGKECLKPVGEWQQYLQTAIKKPQFIIPHPHNGKPAMTGTGNWSFRVADCFPQRKFCIVELSQVSLEGQLAVWLGLMDARFKPMAIISDGEDSVQAWLNATSDREVNQVISCLEPLHYNTSYSFISSMGRLAGVTNLENGQEQKLIYLNSKIK